MAKFFRISDLTVPAKVSDHGSGRNADNDGDCLRITEIREDRRASSYSYYRKDGADQWFDCTGGPVTIELIQDAPKPYRVGAESFFGEVMVAICEGYGVLHPPTVAAFAEAVRNHVATEGCGDQWRALAVARLRGGHPNLYEPEEFIRLITVLDETCLEPHVRREAFYKKRREHRIF